MPEAERLLIPLTVDTLNMHGPPSISIPFPPFGKEEPLIIAPPPPEPSSLQKACDRAGAIARRHPYAVGGGIAVAVTAGIGYAGLATGYGPFAQIGREWRLRRKFGDRGVVENGMLKEAIGKSSVRATPSVATPRTVCRENTISPTDVIVWHR